MLKDKISDNYIKNENAYIKYKNLTNNDVIKLFFQVNHLKNLYRQGWLTKLLGMEYADKAESVADHSWSVAMLAIMVIEKYKLEYNVEKCIKLSLIHEIGEIYAGDFIVGSISKDEKHKLEKQAVEKLLQDIEFENDFQELWDEYEAQSSEEAKFIKQLDKLECSMQAVCYNLDAKHIDGTEILTNPCLIDILSEIEEISKDNDIPLCDRKK
ncbi:MAG: HD domain-containing protein [Clostridia bacterium]|jgi:putative hydrolase of HD superfamily|nr:HD domain-containing protein [Clostridia bacterium]